MKRLSILSSIAAGCVCCLLNAADGPAAKVIGGRNATTDYPGMAALVRSASLPDVFNGQFCGGTLIHPRYVITATDCVESIEPEDEVVDLDTRVLGSPETRKYDVAEIIVHNDSNTFTLELSSAEPLKIVFHSGDDHDETIALPAPEHDQTFTKRIEIRKLPPKTGTVLVKTSAAYPGLSYQIGNSPKRVPLNNRIADIPSGNVRVTFDAPGFQPREYTIPRLEPEGEYQLSVELDPVRQNPLTRPNLERPLMPIFLP